jgi:IclR family transcriptional regulator, acetate operon repressor
MAMRQSDEAAAKGADRVLGVFKALAGYSRGVTLEELAERLGSPKSSVHRALATLRRAGLAEQDRDGRYRFGLEALRLAFSYYDSLDQRVLVQPALDALAERFHETAHYAQLDRGEVVYVAKVVRQDHEGVQLGSRVGGRNPAHCTGVGKVLLSFALPTEEAVESYAAAHPLVMRTASTRVTPAALHADLERVRARGFSIDEEENEAGVGCVALPIFMGPGPQPSGAVSVTTILRRTPLETLLENVEDMREILRRHLPAGAAP